MTNQMLPLDQIRTDGGTQTRAALDQLRVTEYAERMMEGDTFPPVDVWFDGEFYWLSGGFHRLAARKQARSASSQDTAFDEILATIHQGSLRDARLHGVGQNATHGLPRTNEEKRRAVMMLLEDPEWSTWGDNVIARYCHVSQPFVSKLRKSTNNVISKRMYTRNGKVAEMNTSAIGANKPVSPSNDQIAYEWLKAYKDDKGRTWEDLTDNQTWHANSPCWQAFHKDHPKLSKGQLKNARRRLEAKQAAAACTPIWQLETHIRDWLAKQNFSPDVVWRVTLPKLAELKKRSDYWESLTAVFPQPWRVNDAVQAINNVRYQLQQEEYTRATCPDCKGNLTVYGNLARCEPCALPFSKKYDENGHSFWEPVTRFGADKLRARVTTWLRNYLDDQKRTWQDFTTAAETEAHWYFAFQKEFPGASPEVLQEAWVWLERKYKPQDVLVASAGELPDMAGSSAITVDNGECDKDEWYTPAWLIEMVREIMAIDLDPASSHEAQTIVKAKHYWTKQENALSLNWITNIRGPHWDASGVWLNPPYSHPLVEQFVDKLLQQIEKGHVYSAFLLVNNNTETAWWHKAAKAANSVCFFRSRIFFWRPGQGETTSPRQGQTLFYFGPLVGKFADIFSPKGIIYRNKLS